MGIHIEWDATIDFTVGEERHHFKIGTIRFGPELEKWLDRYNAVCKVKVFDGTAHFSAAIREEGGAGDFLRILLGARHQIRRQLQPLGVEWALWERVHKGNLMSRRFRV
ncbi:MAG: hypothetical protein WC343_04055 [Bacilli bacterium]|jgi:hypothetical protein